MYYNCIILISVAELNSNFSTNAVLGEQNIYRIRLLRVSTLDHAWGDNETA